VISIFRNINSFAGKWRFLDASAVFCARILPYFMVIFLAIFYVFTKNIFIFFYALLSGLFARFVINQIIYLFYKEKRPAQFGGTRVLIPVPRYPSFPSGHASFFFGISFYLLFYSIPLAIVFIVCSCLMGIARVFCGVHWFRDILAGVLVGFLSAAVIYGLLNYFK
jgi:undecaprenyl-diphosphatase